MQIFDKKFLESNALDIGNEGIGDVSGITNADICENEKFGCKNGGKYYRLFSKQGDDKKVGSVKFELFRMVPTAERDRDSSEVLVALSEPFITTATISGCAVGIFMNAAGKLWGIHLQPKKGENGDALENRLKTLAKEHSETFAKKVLITPPYQKWVERDDGAATRLNLLIKTGGFGASILLQVVQTAGTETKPIFRTMYDIENVVSVLMEDY